MTTLTNYGGMDAAKDLLKRAVELDSAQRYSEAIICYEEGIQNILRAIGGILHPNLDYSANYKMKIILLYLPSYLPIIYSLSCYRCQR